MLTIMIIIVIIIINNIYIHLYIKNMHEGIITIYIFSRDIKASLTHLGRIRKSMEVTTGPDE